MERRRVIAGATLLLAVGAMAVFTSPSAALDHLRRLAADPFRYGLACLALAAIRPLVAWPVTLIAVAVGFGFGVRAVPLALGLMVLTSLPPYFVARQLGGESRVADLGERIADAAGGTRVIVASRFLPTPSDAISAAAGVGGIRPAAFVLGTVVGETPWAVAGTLAGASLESLVDGSVQFDVRLIVAAGLTALLLLAAPAYRYYRDRNSD